VSSPFVRCVETVLPLAKAFHVKVEEDDALAEGSGLLALLLVRRLANEKIALCTHGDVIPEILVALADEDHLDLGPSPRQAKGSVWVLETEGNHFVKAAYLPPAV
jgi:8-oxo-dGTP diphosphatase